MCEVTITLDDLLALIRRERADAVAEYKRTNGTGRFCTVCDRWISAFEFHAHYTTPISSTGTGTSFVTKWTDTSDTGTSVQGSVSVGDSPSGQEA